MSKPEQPASPPCLHRVTTAVCGAIIIVAIIAAIYLRWNSPPAQPATDVATSESNASTFRNLQNPPQGVGWVFGRVVGYQGADKPLLPRRQPLLP